MVKLNRIVKFRYVLFLQDLAEICITPDGLPDGSKSPVTLCAPDLHVQPELLLSKGLQLTAQ